MSLDIQCRAQSFALNQVFRISRGAKTSADVIEVRVSDGQHVGWGEAVPYARYGETPASAIAQLQQVAASIRDDKQCAQVVAQMPAGAARNALDCALWDLWAQQQRTSVAQLGQLNAVSTCQTAQTLSVDSIDNMQAAARALKGAPLLKIKLDSQQVLEKVAAIHAVSPVSKIIIDANEAWDLAVLNNVVTALVDLNVVLIEQPLPSNQDEQLLGFDSPIPLFADESCHTSVDLARLVRLYHGVNIKLDKAGGLSEAIKMVRQARELNLLVMLGCMVGTSLAMAPAFQLAGQADYVDLDGPLWIAHDRPYGFQFEQGIMCPVSPFLWGTGKGITAQFV